jgi:hypothetical protein
MNFRKCTGMPFSQMLKAGLEDRRIMGEEMPDAAEPPVPVQGKALTDEQWKRIAVKWSVGGDPRAEIVELREHVAALSKPVTDEEWASADFDSEDGEFYMQRYRIDALIAARTAPPPSEPQP